MFLKDRVLRDRTRALEKARVGGVVTEDTEDLVTDIREYFLSVTTISKGFMVVVPNKGNERQFNWYKLVRLWSGLTRYGNDVGHY